MRFGSENRPLVSISMHNDQEKFEKGSIVRDSKWQNIKKVFREVNIDRIEGKSFLNKMEILIVLSTRT